MSQKHSCPRKTPPAFLVVALLLPSVGAYARQKADPGYETYVGTYEISPAVVLEVTLDDGTLYAQATGRRKFELVRVLGHNFLDRTGNKSVKFDLDDDGEVSSVTFVDPSILADAVLGGDVERVRRLIEGGADVHGLDTRPGIAGGNGRRPLNFAALRNDVRMIETLLELGADINRQNLSGFTPLHHAVEARSLEAIALLVSRGADPTIENSRNLTPAELAEASGRSEAAAALAEALASR